jgi:hypothetical protein
MAEPDNIVLTNLIALRNEVADFKREMRQDITEIKAHLSSVDEHITLIHRDMFRFTSAHKSLEERIERIEARLELRDQ